MKKLILAIMYSICIFAFSACSKSDISGRYSGQCVNITVDITADIVLDIEQSGNKISGNLSIISEELGGGGRITGTKNGSEITFTTPDSIGFYPIQWVGVIKGDKIEGFYVSEPKTYFNVKQHGAWLVTRKKSGLF